MTKSDRIWFDELTMNEVARKSKAETVVVLPIGSVEEHGDHLPLGTDSFQPEYVALEVAKKTGCLIVPPLKYGVCNSARNFPGTISVSFESLRNIAEDIMEELVRNGFRRLLVLSGHAGQVHMTALRLAAQNVVCRHESDNAKTVRIIVLSDYDFAYELRGKCADVKDGHAGTIETSRMMAIRPELVKGKGKKSSPKLPRFEVVAHPELYFPSGVIGDPTIASASKGRKMNEYIVKGILGLVEDLKR